MQNKKTAMILCIMGLAAIYQQSALASSTSQVTDNGKKATLTIPLKAIITVDNIIRDSITVTPLSSLYEIAKWEPLSQRFRAHEFIVRVNKDKAVPVLFEIINDQYTCSYYNPDRIPALPADISEVNNGYQYSVSWSGNRLDMGGNRTATVDDPSAWLPTVNNSEMFIDLTLNITFPDVSRASLLMSKGGICRGSVTMLLSNKL